MNLVFLQLKAHRSAFADLADVIVNPTNPVGIFSGSMSMMSAFEKFVVIILAPIENFISATFGTDKK